MYSLWFGIFFKKFFLILKKMLSSKTCFVAFLLCLFQRTSSFPQSCSVCPIGSSYYLSGCFTYFNRRLNWAQAEVCIHDFAYNFKSSSSCSGSFSTLITPKIGDRIVLFYFSKMCTIIQIIGITFSTFSFPEFMSTIWPLSSLWRRCQGWVWRGRRNILYGSFSECCARAAPSGSYAHTEYQ